MYINNATLTVTFVAGSQVVKRISGEVDKMKTKHNGSYTFGNLERLKMLKLKLCDSLDDILSVYNSFYISLAKHKIPFIFQSTLTTFFCFLSNIQFFHNVNLAPRVTAVINTCDSD
jgi:hypothetical protein